MGQTIISGRFLSVAELIEFLGKFPADAKVGPYERERAAGVVVFDPSAGLNVSLGYIECDPVANILQDGDSPALGGEK